MSTLRVNNMTNVGGTGPTNASGHAVQTLSTTKTDAWSTTSTSFVDVTGMSVSITPKSTANKVLVTIHTYIGVNGPTNTMRLNMVRDSTPIALTNNSETTTPYFASSVAGFFVALQYLDTPNTISTTTYKLQARVDGAITGYLGRYAGNDLRTISTITVQEIAA